MQDGKIPMYGVLLSSLNLEEVPLIRNQLKTKNVNWSEFTFKGSIIIYFDENQLQKLPTDDSVSNIKQYLPVYDDSGHSIYRIEKMLEFYKRNNPNGITTTSNRKENK